MRKPNNYWTKERCQIESLKYKYRTVFHNKSKSAYEKARCNNWLDEICSHMEKPSNENHRCIYVYDFIDSVYIGLTDDLKRRNKEHKRQGTVYNYFIKVKYIPKLSQLTDYLEIDEAKKLENFYVEKYKKDGYNILNKIKTGGLGSNILYWTKERCQTEALKYKNRQEYKKTASGSYERARKNYWLDEICSHMNTKQTKKPNYWTKEKCQIEALKYKTKSDFKKFSRGAHSSSLKNNWLHDICKHMNYSYNKKLNSDEIKKIELKYNKYDYNKIFKLYISDNYTKKDVSKKLNISTSQLTRILKIFNIQKNIKTS